MYIRPAWSHTPEPSPRPARKGAGRKQVIDLRKYLLRLAGDGGFRIVGHLTREIRSAGGSVDHEVGKSLADIPAFDGHGAILDRGRGGNAAHCRRNADRPRHPWASAPRGGKPTSQLPLGTSRPALFFPSIFLFFAVAARAFGAPALQAKPAPRP